MNKYNHGYKDILFWDNLYRTKKLRKFKNQVEKYFNSVDYNEYDGSILDNETTLAVREYINLNLSNVQKIMLDASVIPTVVYTDPPAIGGRRQLIDLLDNIFNLEHYDIDSQIVIDNINQAIGVYKGDFASSIIRLFNPFFWLKVILNLTASIPFYLLGAFGFDSQKISDSEVGTFIRVLIKTVVFFFLVVQAASGTWDLAARLKLVSPNADLVQILRGKIGG